MSVRYLTPGNQAEYEERLQRDEVSDNCHYATAQEPWRLHVAETIGPSLTFKVPRPQDSVEIRIDLEGTYVSESHQFEVGDYDDPEGAVETFRPSVGGQLTLRILPVSPVSPAERDSFRGLPVGLTDVYEGYFGEAVDTRLQLAGWAEYVGFINAESVVILNGVRPGPWGPAIPLSAPDSEGLSPWMIDPRFRVNVEKGRKTAVDVPLIRGLMLHGRVVDEAGVAVSDAKISAIGVEVSRPGSHSTKAQLFGVTARSDRSGK